MATEILRWPDRPWASRSRKEIIAYSMSLTHYAKIALGHGLGGHRDIPLIRELLPSIQAEARDILLACQRMRLARQEERYRLPNWVSYAIRDWPEVEDVDMDKLNWGQIVYIENIPALAQKVVLECQVAKGLGERPKELERLTLALDFCVQAGQRIQEIVMKGLPPKGSGGHTVFDLIKEVLNGLDDNEISRD